MRFDVIIDDNNTPNHIVDWIEDKYKLHNGTKSNFMRQLLIELYNYENNQGTLKKILSNIGNVEIKEDSKDMSKNDMDDILNQF